jgi:hypothetical protein
MRVSAIVRCLVRPALRVSTLALVSAVSLAACNETPLPGTQYGMYKVTGTSTTNTCGPYLNAPDPWVFDAQLSLSGDTLYWSFLDGNAPLSGLLSSRSATLTTSITSNVDATDAGAGPCTMTRADTIEVALATGSPPPTFTGSISYTFTIASGATCTDQLATSGGQYATLPCTVSYSTTAAHQ